MCGIAGTFGLAEREVIDRMSAAQAHRGPDDAGLYLDPVHQIALGHRRLSIIDCTPAGHQPMSYAANRYWITYNGEVYNFAEIRTDLEKKGYTFSSQTDTEVILAAYVEWHTACLERFRGIFAFAIWDRDEQQLFLARDHFGVKPLYWAQVNGIFLFASEIKGMLASGLITKQLDRQAIWDYLSLASVPPPRTILADVSALLPGHCMVVENDHVKIEQYWDLQKSPNSDRMFPSTELPECKMELRQLLEESTRLNMVADVPVGAFLSGGVDSTAIVALMSQHISQPLKTYSVGFISKNKHISELPWAKIVAERFGTDHTEILVSGEDVATEFDRLIEAIDQPSGDGVNTYFVSKATRTDVTVALSGLGGDELFAGYPQFARFTQAERLLSQGSRLITKATRRVGNLLPGRWRQWLQFLGDAPPDRHASIRCLYNEAQKENLTSSELGSTCSLQPIVMAYMRYLRPELDVIARTTYVEAKGYMAHTLLRDTDAMSMAHSLEVRVPLLDHVLAEFAFRLPANLKLDGHNTKVLLKDALHDLVPTGIIQRPKMGFELPMGQWLSDSLRPIINDVLSTSQAQEIFSFSTLDTFRQQVNQGCVPYYMSIWAPVVLIAWMHLYDCWLEE